MRKLSYSILMNPGEYEGGDFIHKVGRKDVGHLEGCKEQGQAVTAGTMILFPSYILHRVAEVTSGTRYSMVGWAHGNSFK
jgi:PKHD-type hydroxylase